MVKMVITDGGFGGDDDCHPHDLTISVPLPDREVPNGEHPIHVDLKVLGVKPVSFTRLDLCIIVIIIITIIIIIIIIVNIIIISITLVNFT